MLGATRPLICHAFGRLDRDLRLILHIFILTLYVFKIFYPILWNL